MAFEDVGEGLEAGGDIAIEAQGEHGIVAPAQAKGHEAQAEIGGADSRQRHQRGGEAQGAQGHALHDRPQDETRVARVLEDVAEADDAEHTQHAKGHGNAVGHGQHRHRHQNRQDRQGPDEVPGIGKGFVGPHINKTDGHAGDERQDEDKDDGQGVGRAGQIGVGDRVQEVVHKMRSSSRSGRTV